MILQYINCVTYEQFVRKLGKPLFGLVFCYSAASGRSSEPGPQILELVRYSHIAACWKPGTLRDSPWGLDP
jgi:hypothetical protein